MVTEIDHDAVARRIVDILQNNSTLYDEAGVDAKLANIEAGHPHGHAWKDKIFPYAFVSFRNERTTLFGSRTGNEIHGAKHVATYDIIFGVDEKDARTAETSLNDFQKLILQTLEENIQLKDPTLSNDPKCVYSIASVDGTVTETIGFDIQSRVISLVCHFRTGTDTSKIVNSSNVVLTNETDAKIFKLLFNVRPFITSTISKFQLTDSTWDKFTDVQDYAIEADMFLDYSELATWISYMVQTNNTPLAKSFSLKFPDKDANTTTLTSTFYVASLAPSATDDRDTNIHIRLESTTGAVAVT